MKVPLSARDHIQAYKHGLGSLLHTKVLANKCLHEVDALLDVVNEFIQGEISVQSKRDHLENGLMEIREKKAFRYEQTRPFIWDRLSFLYSRGYHVSRGRNS